MTAKPSQNEAWTIGRLLEWTTGYLKERGAESPRLDAEVLLAEARGCQRIELYTAFDETPAEPVRIAFRELVRRRAEGMPVAYLVGRKEFYSLSFAVTPEVLIPRPETEFLVVGVIDRAKPQAAGKALRIADVGVGSGAVAVSVAKHLPTVRVTAVDNSSAALAVSLRNAEAHGVAERIEFIESDLLSQLPAEPAFDFVASNPPYVTTEEWERLPPHVRLFEPRQALDAGPKGTEVIARLIPQAAERLLAGGWLLMEISPMIEGAVKRLLADDGRFQTPAVQKDLAGLARVIAARRG